MTEFEVTATYRQCRTCRAPMVIFGRPDGPLSLASDEHGQRFVTPHVENCAELALFRPDGTMEVCDAEEWRP